MKGDILYECDPIKNTKCTKETCALIRNNDWGICSLTFEKKYAKDNGKVYKSIGLDSESGKEELIEIGGLS